MLKGSHREVGFAATPAPITGNLVNRSSPPAHVQAGFTRFLIVDDHPVVSFAMNHLIGAQPGWRVAGLASCPADAMARLERDGAEVILVDLMFPGSSGLEFVSWISVNAPRSRLVVYSIQPEEIYARRCIRAGAHGYVGKDAGVDILLATIRLVLEGRTAIAGHALDEPVREAVRGPASDKLECLSNRELEVLDLLGQGLSNRRIAKLLCRTAKTIESHRYRMSRKLGIANGPELVHFALQHRLAASHSLPLPDARNGTPPPTGIAV